MTSLSREPQPRAGAAAVSASPEVDRPDADQLRGLLLGAALVAALVLWVFWHFISAQVRFAIRQQADWGHTLVIPLIAGYIVYLNRRRLLSTAYKTTWIGLVPIVLGTAWYMLCWLGPPTLRHHNLQGAGLTLTLFGIVLLFFGFRGMAFLWFPLLYMCVFGQQISTRLMTLVTYPLQDLTARGSHVVLNLVGIDTDREGNILTVWDSGVAKPLNIAEACSGMRMLMAFLALGVAMAYTGFKRTWQRITLVALGIPTAIVVNVLRVTTLAVLVLYDADSASPRHRRTRARDRAPGRCRRRGPEAGVGMMFDRQAKPALIVTAVTLLVCGVGFRFAARAAEAYFAKQPVELRRQLTRIPRQLGPWRSVRQDVLLTAELEESLGTSYYVDRVYERERADGESDVVSVHIPYYTGLIDAVPHVADRCLIAGGWVSAGLTVNVDLPIDRTSWRPDPQRVNLDTGKPYPVMKFQDRVTDETHTVRMPINDFRLRTTEFRDGANPDVRIYAGYFFIANGQTTPNPEGVRVFAFNLKTKYAYFAKIQFTMYAPEQMTREEFAEAVADLAAELLPELMLCLPDWSEIESESAAPAA
ncbi:MAG: exosortase/archaeosortase family protein [Planctomycetota bacterium]